MPKNKSVTRAITPIMELFHPTKSGRGFTFAYYGEYHSNERIADPPETIHVVESIWPDIVTLQLDSSD